MGDSTGRETLGQPSQIAFDYIKGKFFRVIHADGVIGGPTPNGSISVAFFSERGPIPQKEVRSLNIDGSLGDFVADKSIVRPAIVREVDVDVMMSVPVAEIVISWLQQRVEEIKRRSPSEQPQQEGQR